MSSLQSQGLVRKYILTDAELARIEQLVDLCNRYEDLHMRLSFTMLRARAGTTCNDFLYYVDGTLAGYFSLDNWGSEEKEVDVMVHPDHRRKGIFQTLLAAAQEECLERDIQRMLLICEQTSASGQACIQAIGARHAFSEHEMLLENFQERYAFDEVLFFRAASINDLDALVSIGVASFDEPEASARERLNEHFQNPRCRLYIATFGEGELSCHEPVGLIRVDEFDQHIGIYGFGLIPDYRGRGYGRQILEETIRTIPAADQKRIMLEVETNNTPALNLYKSCGFQIRTTYDYYVVDVHFI